MNNKVAQFPNKIHVNNRVKLHNIASINDYKANQDKKNDKESEATEGVIHIVFVIIFIPIALFMYWCLKGVS